MCGLFIVACRPSNAGPKAIVDADRAFNRATADHRADGWAEFFADDGAMIRSSGTVTGKSAVHDVMAKTFADTSFTLTWDPDHGEISGDVGYTDGHFAARFRDDKGDPVVRTGRYLTVWKKQKTSCKV